MHLGRDSLHMLGTFFFADPDSDHPRQVNVEDDASESGYQVTAANSETHLPGAGAYLEEADRLLRALLAAMDERDDAE